MRSNAALEPVTSAKALTLAAHAAFVPIGVVTVLLSPLLPTLSARWSLSYSQAGALFTAQFLASTVAVSLSGVLIARWGFRLAIKAGLVMIGASVAALLAGSRLLAMTCIAGYGVGLGLAVPAANLLVAEVNPGRRSAALNLLNFSWSVGAVACPFLVAAFARNQRVPWFLALVAGLALLVAAAIWAMPASTVEPRLAKIADRTGVAAEGKHRSFPVLAMLFFVYVGTENSFGGWVASYATSLGSMSATMAVMTPSFFYIALMLGRWLAPLALRRIEEVRVAQACLVLACVGMAGLMGSGSLPGVAVSASAAGLGLSAVYPITISLLSREFGARASRLGSFMFTSANLGGAFLPWLVGLSSSGLGSLRLGMAVPLGGAGLMFFLYLRDWKAEAGEQTVQDAHP